MTNMNSFAKRMMRINQRGTTQNVPTAIFGKLASLSEDISGRPAYRVGLWPCTSDDSPLHAMGLWAAFAYLLERWRDIEVYRLFTTFADDQEEFQTWDISQMQFNVEDWEVEALDENIGIWGEYKAVDDGFELRVFIENDLLTGQDSETQEIALQAPDLSSMIQRLPNLSAQVADAIGASLLDETLPTFTQNSIVEQAKTETLFEQVLQWEARLLAHLWDIEWDDTQIIADYEALVDAGKVVLEQGDFAAWIVAQCVAQTMRPGYSVVGDLLVENINMLYAAFSDAPNAIPLVAEAVFTMGQAQDAYNLLEDHTEDAPKNAASWLKLGDLYARGGRAAEAIDRLQTAIEKEAVDQYLYFTYGGLLTLVDQYQDTFVEEFVLIDPDVYDEQDLLSYEAIAAYDESLKLNPQNPRVWYAKLVQLAAVGEEELFWADFVKLLPLDPTGEYTRELIEDLYDFDDLDSGIQELQKLQQEDENRLDVYINLGSLYLTAEDEPAAKEILEQARQRTDAIPMLAEIESLLLQADDPEFEYRFGELSTIVAAGNALNADDVEYLEDSVEKAPHFVEAQLTLAQAYDAWGDKDAALEVLLDAHEKLPDHPEILHMLTRILWDSGERELAFQYLNRGLESFPFDVRLLVQAGRLLFINGQYVDSRRYLSLAEEIQPRNPDLAKVKMLIAREMAEKPGLMREDEEEE